MLPLRHQAPSQSVIKNISDMKGKDLDFTDDNLKNIVEMTQAKTKEFGVRVFRVDLLNPSN